MQWEFYHVISGTGSVRHEDGTTRRVVRSEALEYNDGEECHILMITATSERSNYLTRITNGAQVALSDTTSDKGGGGQGFRPHELLEAALAACMNMTLRMYADEHGLVLEHVTTTVTVNRNDPEKAVFEYRVDVRGDLSREDRRRLMAVAARCPVRKTLSRMISFSQDGAAV